MAVKTLTANGNAKISTASPKFGTGSGIFTGKTTGDFVTTPAVADWAFGTGNFTIDFWVKRTDTTSSTGFVVGQVDDSSNWWGICAYPSGDIQFASITTSGWLTNFTTNVATLNNGSWHHIAIVRKANTGSASDWLIFYDGTLQTNTLQAGSYTATLASFTGNLSVGGNSLDQLAHALIGNIDELRITKGTARWTSNFTPPSAEYSSQADTNCNLLMHMNGANNSTTFIDSEYIGIAVDASSNSGDQTASSNYTFNRTVSGANTFLSVDVELLTATGATVTSVTDDYGGGNVAMTLIGVKSTVTGAGRVECWGLVNPTAGTKSIRVVLSTAIESVATAVSYTGVNQTTPTETFNSNQATNTGSATDASVVITPISDNCWIHTAVVTNDTSITANQTSRNNIAGTLGSGANEDNNAPVTPAGATTMSYTGMGVTATWAIAGYAIIPVQDSNYYTLIVGIGTYVLTGEVITLKRILTLIATLGTYVLTGIATAFKRLINIIATTGHYVLTGIATSLFKGHTMIADVGYYAVTGFSILFNRLINIYPTTGYYVVTGISETLGRIYTLLANTGYYIVTGINTTFNKAWKLTVTQGSYVYTGFASTFKRMITLIATTGYYIITGIGDTFQHIYMFAVATGHYTVTGVSAILAKVSTLILSGDTGLYVLTGKAVSFYRILTLITTTGKYILTGFRIHIIAPIHSAWKTLNQPITPTMWSFKTRGD